MLVVLKKKKTNHEEPRGILDAVDKVSRVYKKNHEEVLRWEPTPTPNSSTKKDRANVGHNVKLREFRYSKIKK